MRDRIFFKGMSKVLPAVKDRWVPLYYERGRVEQENYSLQFVGADGGRESIPIAQISCLLLGPGTTITHAAVVSCSKTNTPIAWVGEDSMSFYSCGVSVNEKCETARRQAELFADPQERERVARKMFQMRFKEDVSNESIPSLRGKEGYRVQSLYESLAKQHGVRWERRNSSGMIFGPPDDLNRMLNIANHRLYAMCLSAITTMGYITSLGFIHVDGKIPFVYDIADLYKDDLTIATCFSVYGRSGREDNSLVEEEMREKIVRGKLLRKIPENLKELIS